MGGTGEDLAKQSKSQREMFRILREEELTDEAKSKIRTIAMQTINNYTEDQLKAMGVSKEAVEGQLQMMFSSYFIELINYDPGTTLQKVQCPVLAINGEKDLQVAARENLAAIEQWVKKGGNDDVTVIEFPGLNHLFQACETGAIAEYGQIEETFNPEALNAISDWVVLKTKGR